MPDKTGADSRLDFSIKVMLPFPETKLSGLVDVPPPLHPVSSKSELKEIKRNRLNIIFS